MDCLWSERGYYGRKWVKALSLEYKVLFDFIWRNTDKLGRWPVDFDSVYLYLGLIFDPVEAEKILSDQIIVLDDGEYWFLKHWNHAQFQKFNDSNPARKAQKIKLLDEKLFHLLPFHSDSENSSEASPSLVTRLVNSPNNNNNNNYSYSYKEGGPGGGDEDSKKIEWRLRKKIRDAEKKEITVFWIEKLLSATRPELFPVIQDEVEKRSLNFLEFFKRAERKIRERREKLTGDIPQEPKEEPEEVLFEERKG